MFLHLAAAVVVCSKAPENITVLEGDAANFTVKCFGEHKFDFTLYFDTFDESAVGRCLHNELCSNIYITQSHCSAQLLVTMCLDLTHCSFLLVSKRQVC